MASQDSWQLHCAELKQRGSYLFHSKIWSDCTFQLEDVTIKAHRLIMAMASPVFSKMLYGSFVKFPMYIDDVRPEIFNLLLEYIYSDNLNIQSSKDACDLYYAGKRWRMPYVTKCCMKYLLTNMSPSNVCHIYKVACESEDQELQSTCEKIFSSRTKEVLEDESFLDVDVPTLKKLFSLKLLNIDSELDLFYALVTYAKFHDQGSENLKRTSGCSLVDYERSPSPKKSTRDSGDREEFDCDDNDENLEESNQTNDSNQSADELSQDDIDLKTKRKYRDIVNTIRFLTLTPREFAECQTLAYLLTPPEILSLGMNISSKVSPYQCPEGFCTNMVPRTQATQEDRSRLAAVFRSIIHNFRNMRKYESIPFYLRNLAWTFRVTRMMTPGSMKYNKERFVLVVTCFFEDGIPEWVKKTKVKVKFITHKPVPKQLHKITLRKNVSTPEHDSWIEMLDLEELLDPAYGFVDDFNTVTYKLYINTVPRPTDSPDAEELAHLISDQSCMDDTPQLKLRLPTAQKPSVTSDQATKSTSVSSKSTANSQVQKPNQSVSTKAKTSPNVTQAQTNLASNVEHSYASTNLGKTGKPESNVVKSITTETTSAQFQSQPAMTQSLPTPKVTAAASNFATPAVSTLPQSKPTAAVTNETETLPSVVTPTLPRSTHTKTSSTQARPSPIMIPPMTQPSSIVTPSMTRPSSIMAPPMTRPSSIVTPSMTRPSPITAPPTTQPFSITTPPMTQPSSITTPPMTRPSSITIPPMTQPPSITTPPMTRPSSITTPPMTQPSSITTPPMTRPSSIMTPPMTRPSPIVTPPMTRPSSITTPPMTKPSSIVPPPMTRPSPTVTPPIQTRPPPTVTPPTQTRPPPTVTPPTQTRPPPTETLPMTRPSSITAPPTPMTRPSPITTPPMTRPSPGMSPDSNASLRHSLSSVPMDAIRRLARFGMTPHTIARLAQLGVSPTAISIISEFKLSPQAVSRLTATQISPDVITRLNLTKIPPSHITYMCRSWLPTTEIKRRLMQTGMSYNEILPFLIKSGRVNESSAVEIPKTIPQSHEISNNIPHAAAPKDNKITSRLPLKSEPILPNRDDTDKTLDESIFSMKELATGAESSSSQSNIAIPHSSAQLKIPLASTLTQKNLPTLTREDSAKSLDEQPTARVESTLTQSTLHLHIAKTSDSDLKDTSVLSIGETDALKTDCLSSTTRFSEPPVTAKATRSTLEQSCSNDPALLIEEEPKMKSVLKPETSSKASALPSDTLTSLMIPIDSVTVDPPPTLLSSEDDLIQDTITISNPSLPKPTKRTSGPLHAVALPWPKKRSRTVTDDMNSLKADSETNETKPPNVPSQDFETKSEFPASSPISFDSLIVDPPSNIPLNDEAFDLPQDIITISNSAVPKPTKRTSIPLHAVTLPWPPKRARVVSNPISLVGSDPEFDEMGRNEKEGKVKGSQPESLQAIALSELNNLALKVDPKIVKNEGKTLVPPLKYLALNKLMMDSTEGNKKMTHNHNEAKKIEPKSLKDIASSELRIVLNKVIMYEKSSKVQKKSAQPPTLKYLTFTMLRLWF